MLVFAPTSACNARSVYYVCVMLVLQVSTGLGKAYSAGRDRFEVALEADLLSLQAE